MAGLGYLAACLVAAVFATFTIMSVDPAALRENWETAFTTLFFLGATFVTVTMTAFWPFLVVLVVTEGIRLRGFVAHLLAGVLVGAVYGFPLTRIFSGEDMPAVSGSAVQLTLACGGLGGIVYWLIAGRTAGRWSEYPWFEENRR